MKVLNQLLNFYINSSIHVALSVFSLAWITLIEFEVPYDVKVLNFIFFASITGYNFVKYFGLAKFHHRNLATWLKAIQVFSFFCFLFMTYYLFALQPITLLYIAGFGLITFFYAIPLLPKHLFVDSKQNLRSIGGLKVYLIAFVWSGVTVFIPLINNEYPINTDVIITSIQRFIFIVILMLPFEIRDLQYDSLKLGTIPQKIGVKWTKIIGLLLLLLFFSLEFFKYELSINQLIALIIITLISLGLILYSSKNQGMFYSSLYVEGLPILWLLLLLILNYFN